MIIAAITGPATADAEAQIRASAPFASMFELRLDLVGDAGVEALLRLAGKPVVATCRPVWERGAFRGSERARLNILDGAASLGAQYVDLEWKIGRGPIGDFMRRHPATKVIVSRHLAPGELPLPGREYASLRRSGGAVLKLAFDARDACDNALAFEFLRLASRDRQKAVGIAMGEAGEASRILYKRFGGWATFAAPEGGPPSASGQVSSRMLSRLFRADRLNGKTRIFGLVGNPVRYSLGVYLHNPLMERGGANAVYCRFPVTDLDAFMATLGKDASGLSITLPHKERMLHHVDLPDGAALAVGAVNTMVRRRGRWRGTNTDAAGALDAIEEVQPVRGKRMLVLGAGGAARAIVYEALRRRAVVMIANRTHERARRVARALGAEAVRLESVHEVDIIANATSVGMAPRTGETPVPSGAVRAAVAFDAVYTPPDTRFLREARAAGARTVSGLTMYMHQASMQFRLFVRKDPDKLLLRELLAEDAPATSGNLS